MPGQPCFAGTRMLNHFAATRDVEVFPFSALTLLVGRQEGHLAYKSFACKKLGVG